MHRNLHYGLGGVWLALLLLVTPSLEGRTSELGQSQRRPNPETESSPFLVETLHGS